MKILAVSDVQSRSLENMVAHSPERLTDVALIISCGDLNRGYLEVLVDGLNKELFFVHGNHKLDDDFDTSFGGAMAGGADLHGRVEAFQNYLIAGFGGTLWYNGRKNQFRENEMAGIVRQVERKIRWYRLQEKLLGMKRRDVIVVSHAPVFKVHDQPDLCHTGFQCFREFIDRISPLLWLHGHVHLPDFHRSQVSLVGGTTVINTYGCKFIKIDAKRISVSPHCD